LTERGEPAVQRGAPDAERLGGGGDAHPLFGHGTDGTESELLQRGRRQLAGVTRVHDALGDETEASVRYFVLWLVFFEFVHNVQRRGKALLGSLIQLLVAPRNPG